MCRCVRRRVPTGASRRRAPLGSTPSPSHGDAGRNAKRSFRASARALSGRWTHVASTRLVRHASPRTRSRANASTASHGRSSRNLLFATGSKRAAIEVAADHQKAVFAGGAGFRKAVLAFRTARKAQGWQVDARVVFPGQAAHGRRRALNARGRRGVARFARRVTARRDTRRRHIRLTGRGRHGARGNARRGEPARAARRVPGLEVSARATRGHRSRRAPKTRAHAPRAARHGVVLPRASTRVPRIGR